MEWPSETDTASPSPAETKRDSIFLFHRYSTPDILRKNANVTPSAGDGDVQGTTSPDETAIEEPSFNQGSEETPMEKDKCLSRSQRRAVTMRIKSLLEDLDSALKDMSIVETELKTLDLKIHQLNEVLKVR